VRADGPGGRYTYYPYGEVKTSTGPSGLYADLEDPVRGYDSNAAKWNTPDPLGMKAAILGDPGSWNRYAYAGGDPKNHIDPKGLKWFWAIVGYDRVQEGFDSITEEPMYNEIAIWDWVWEDDETPSTDSSSTISTVSDLLNLSRQRLRDDLKKTKCASLFTNVDDVLAKINKIGISDQGMLQFHTEDGKEIPNEKSPGLAQYSRITKSVNLNSQVDWSNPNYTLAGLDAAPWYYRAADAEAYFLGLGSITAEQLMDIVLLHELSHYRGTLDPHVSGSERTLWDNCIK
jgi:RHS repeat-associated protein